MGEDVLMFYWCSVIGFRTGGSWKEQTQPDSNVGCPGILLLCYGDTMA
jgi:hypothetical protein